jgi:raffinose/stachyose/melibiose transport system permease protein
MTAGTQAQVPAPAAAAARQEPSPPRPGWRRRVAAFSPGTYLIMAVLVVLTIYPMIWMLLGAFKSLGEFYTNIWGLPEVWRWSNFAQAWSQVQLGQKFINSIIATVGTLILTLPLCSMAGYAFAKVDFPLRRYVYYFMLAGIMIPFGVTAIPVLTTEVSLGLFDTRIGLILVYAAQNLPFGIFLMYSFFQSIPAELEEAGLIDGCNRFKAFIKIVLPLAKPGLATLLIFTGTSVWNEYLMASVLIHQQNLETLPLGLVNFTTAHSTNYPELFAALSIVTAPVVLLYLVAQRQFISGLTAGALKG